MIGLIRKSRIFLVLVVIWSPTVLFSQGAKITEILYDAPGSDTGREWVEILVLKNDIDLTTWRFEENKTKHKIKYFQGKTLLSDGDCLVLADNPDKFLSDWPDFKGNLFDSTFSLKNKDGEELKILSPETGDEYNIEDQLTYKPVENFTDGDWFSLGRIDNDFVKSIPTPGLCQGDGSNDMGNNAKDDTVAKTDTDSNTQNNSYQIVVPKIFLKVDGRFEPISVGSKAFFSAKVYGSQSQIIKNPRVVWSFGDGYKSEGVNISHTWNYPGAYYLVVNASSNESVDTFYHKIIVKEAKVNLEFLKRDTNFDSRLIIKNLGDFDLDISGWFLKNGEDIFIFPKDTIILRQGLITVDKKLTGFNLDKLKVNLFYPNGTLVKLSQKIVPVNKTTALSEKVIIPPKAVQDIKSPPSVLPNQKVKIQTSKSQDTNFASSSDDLGLGNELSAGPIESNATWPYLLGVLGLIGAGILVVYRSNMLDDDKTGGANQKDTIKKEIKKEAKSFKIMYDKHNE